MTLKSAHPDPELLTRYNRGDLEPEQFDEVETHILACDSCCEKLQDLPGDSFIEKLESLSRSSSPLEIDSGEIDPHHDTVGMSEGAIENASTSQLSSH